MCRRCFRPPIPEHDRAADLLSRAADALLEGNLQQAETLLLGRKSVGRKSVGENPSAGRKSISLNRAIFKGRVSSVGRCLYRYKTDGSSNDCRGKSCRSQRRNEA